MLPRKRTNARNKRKLSPAHKPPRIDATLTYVSKTGSTITVSSDIPLNHQGLPKFNMLRSATNYAAVSVSISGLSITVDFGNSLTIATADVVSLPGRDPGLRTETGGYCYPFAKTI